MHPYSWYNNIPKEIWELFSHDMDEDEKFLFMLEAVEEGERNPYYPSVGAVVVRDGNIVGRGHNYVTDTNHSWPIRIYHAEHAALLDAGRLTQGADLYTTLEPCCYRGQSSEIRELFKPCCAFIEEAGISRVVIGLIDISPRMYGNGVRELLHHGIRVEYCFYGLEDRLHGILGSRGFMYDMD